MTIFVWTGTGVYPAGPNDWNGQPLAIAPPGTWWTPELKPIPEFWNYILAQIATNLATINTQLQGLSGSQTFTAGGTFTVPAGVTQMVAELWGGGGGGGGGATGLTGVSDAACGGSGGAGSQRIVQTFAVAPGDVLDIAVGSAGTPGLVGTSQPGAGGYSQVYDSTAAATCAFAPGGAAGQNGVNVNFASNVDGTLFLPGGSGNGNANTVPAAPAQLFTFIPFGLPTRAGDGGTVQCSFSATPINSYDGLPQSSFLGGTGGAQPASTVHATNYASGSGGSGGGAGPGGPGGPGGAGGVAVPAGTGAPGVGPASAPAPNSGAGGGGAGGGGGGVTAGGAGAEGSVGATGKVVLRWVVNGVGL